MDDVKIRDEVFNAVKAELEKYPNVESIEKEIDKYNHEEIVVHCKNEDKDFQHNMLGEDGPIEKILNSFGLEVGGVGQISNWDEWFAAEKKFEAENPEPQDPTRDYAWKKRSYYDRTKGEGSRIYAQYKNEHIDWIKRKNDTLPPRHLPGFTFSIFTKGHSAEVQAFYNSLRYKGD